MCSYCFHSSNSHAFEMEGIVTNWSRRSLSLPLTAIVVVASREEEEDEDEDEDEDKGICVVEFMSTSSVSSKLSCVMNVIGVEVKIGIEEPV